MLLGSDVKLLALTPLIILLSLVNFRRRRKIPHHGQKRVVKVSCGVDDYLTARVIRIMGWVGYIMAMVILYAECPNLLLNMHVTYIKTFH